MRLLPGKIQDHRLQGHIHLASISNRTRQDQVPSQDRHVCQAPAQAGRRSEASPASGASTLYGWAHTALLSRLKSKVQWLPCHFRLWPS